MKKTPQVFIKHILESIEFIENYSNKTTQPKFLKSNQLQDAIVTRLEIIGEAVKNLPTAFKEKHPGVPWKQMAGMRDIPISIEIWNFAIAKEASSHPTCLGSNFSIVA